MNHRGLNNSKDKVLLCKMTLMYQGFGYPMMILMPGNGKSVWGFLFEGLWQEFETELEIVGSIKHQILVSLHGYYKKPHGNLLFYDYMVSKSLWDILH
ncbi:hypothetical protein KI387_003091, partial [Taxus chinensis]